jgi:uncharacterized paraquat-inducible protein A
VSTVTASAGPGCPRCWTHLPDSVLEKGAVYCGTCGLDFQAELFTPPVQARAILPAPEAGGAAPCARHAGNAAASACERCGAFMCTLCRVDSDGLVLCAGCFDRLRGEGSLASARTTFRSWRTLGLHLAVLGLPLVSLGVFIGPVAIYASVRGMTQSRKHGDEGGLAGPILSLILGILVTAGGIFFALSMAGAFRPRK